MNTLTQRTIFIVLLLLVASVFISLGGAQKLSAEEESPRAVVSNSNVTIPGNGSTASSRLTVDASEGISVADITVSVDTDIVKITSVQPGEDVDTSSPAVLFEVVNQTPDSVLIQYTDISASGPAEDFRLASIEFTAQSGTGETVIVAEVSELFDANNENYSNVEINQGGIKIIESIFTSPLSGFDSAPTNTGELDSNLIEDIDGDGDGLDPSQSVQWWTELVVNGDEFDDLSQEQVDALDWNGDGELTPEDAVSLWTEQVVAGS